jgi:DNA processing protein
MDYNFEQLLRIWLASSRLLTRKALIQLMDYYASAQAVLDHLGSDLPFVSPRALRELRDMRDAGMDKLVKKLDVNGAYAVFRGESGYPALLAQIPDPPVLLFIRGSMPDRAENAIAIVGSRHETRYGREQARQIARGLALGGVTVVSGLARGIDSAAHEGALAGSGRTVAVQGCGIARVYPEDNRELADRIIAGGGAIVSEFAPDAEPLAFHFPIRNRLVSGMCQGVLLVEGRENSGTMITVNCALEQGREVFALPGQVDSPSSVAPHRILREGARICTSPADILEDMGWTPLRGQEKQPDRPFMRQLTLEEAAITRFLENEQHSFEEIVQETGIPPGEAGALLTILEMDGLIRALAGRVYALNQA